MSTVAKSKWSIAPRMKYQLVDFTFFLLPCIFNDVGRDFAFSHVGITFLALEMLNNTSKACVGSKFVVTQTLHTFVLTKYINNK